MVASQSVLADNGHKYFIVYNYVVQFNGFKITITLTVFAYLIV